MGPRMLARLYTVLMRPVNTGRSPGRTVTPRIAYPPAAIPAALAPRMARPRIRTVLLGARPAVKTVGQQRNIKALCMFRLLTAD